MPDLGEKVARQGRTLWLLPALPQCPKFMAQFDAEPLNERQRSIIVIAAFTASGDLDRLKPVLDDGLDAGLAVNEIKEVLVQMYAYAGFPRSLNGLGSFMAVLDARKSRGIADKPGREATPVPVNMFCRICETTVKELL